MQKISSCLLNNRMKDMLQLSMTTLTKRQKMLTVRLKPVGDDMMNTSSNSFKVSTTFSAPIPPSFKSNMTYLRPVCIVSPLWLRINPQFNHLRASLDIIRSPSGATFRTILGILPVRSNAKLFATSGTNDCETRHTPPTLKVRQLTCATPRASFLPSPFGSRKLSAPFASQLWHTTILSY